MRIALIGAPSAGKTVYITGLYKRFSQRIAFPPLSPKMQAKYRERNIRQRCSLALRIDNAEEASTLAQDAKILDNKPIVDEIPPNLHLHQLPLTLSFRFKPVDEEGRSAGVIEDFERKVTFYDPPGGVFDSSHDDTANIRRELEKCDVYMVFLSARSIAPLLADLNDDFENISEVIDAMYEALKIGIVADHIKALAAKHKASRITRRFPVCFIISQVDLLSDELREKLDYVIYQKVVGAFTEDNPSAIACVCPISVIREAPVGKVYYPFALEWPFMFAAGAAVLNSGYEHLDKALLQADAAANSDVRAARQEALAADLKALAERSFFDRMVRFLNDWETADDAEQRARNARQRSQAAKSQSSSIQAQAHRDMELSRNVWTALMTEGDIYNVRLLAGGLVRTDPRELV